MQLRLPFLFLLTSLAAFGVIIDQIAIVVNRQIIKQSDILRDIRVTDFLNHDPLNLGVAAQKKAANRLIDQAFIRHEVYLGDYAIATFQEADRELSRLEKERYKTEAALQESLRAYGLTIPDLRYTFRWQLTVLRFIDVRFKPAVVVSDSEVEDYYKSHLAALRRAHPSGYSLADLRSDIRDTLVSEKVNQQFFSWLDEQRRDAKIQFLEANLR
jgi:hypothetical protein